MEQITFLIGNGFDINVGLKTRYKDFYKYYLKNNPNDMLAKSIGKDCAYWSDLEEGLGMYTARVSKKEADEFWKSEERLETSLADYLELQMGRIYVSDENRERIAHKMRQALMNFYEELPKEQKQFLLERIQAMKHDVQYSFISFNYTDAFDRCVEWTRERFNRTLGVHQYGGFSKYHFIGNVLHIHGTTNEDMILGVNDVTQIGNKDFADDLSYRQWLIKEESNKRLAQNKVQEMRDIIDKSKIICVFGLSLGTTDKMWWNYLCMWLYKDEAHRLILFARREVTAGRMTRMRLFLEQDSFLERFKRNADMQNAKEDVWEQIKERIFIKFDSELFDFKMVED